MNQSLIQPKFKTSKEAVFILRAHLSTKQIKLPKNASLEEYIQYIKKLCKRLHHDSLNFVIPNAYRRVIQIIRQLSTEEGFVSQPEKPFKELSAAITGVPLIRSNSKSHTEGPAIDAILNYFVLPAVDQLVDELESYQEDINSFASLHFFTNEVIMVYEYSTTVINFLLSMKKVRNLEIIVIESETEELGKQCAEQLKGSLSVTLLPFTNSFAVMQRVNKVLLGVDAILKNGGLLMHPGTYALCVAAKQFSVPTIVLSGAHKLTPKYAFDQSTFNEVMSPLQINDNPSLDSLSIGVTYDYVPPEYISLYITNQGQYTPESIYQLFNDFYNSKDEDL